MKAKTLLAAIAICAVALTGCGSQETNTGVSAPRAEVTGSATPTETRKALPQWHSADAIAAFGQDNLETLGEEMQAFVGLTLANGAVASGKITPAQAVEILPLSGAAAKQAKKNPTGLVMDTLGGAVTPVAPYATGSGLTSIGTPKVNDDQTVTITFTGHASLFFTENGAAKRGDISRTYTLTLTPATTEVGATDLHWYVTEYSTSDIAAAPAVAVKAGE